MAIEITGRQSDKDELTINSYLLSRINFMRKIFGAAPPKFSGANIWNDDGSVRWNQLYCSYSSVWHIIIVLSVLWAILDVLYPFGEYGNRVFLNFCSYYAPVLLGLI